jgi:hypothetical protein
MKEMLRVLCIFSFFIMFSACATTQNGFGLPAKYDLGKELKEIDQINTFQLSSWEEVDHQSIILETSRHKYYLLVLRRPMIGVIPSLTIGISSTISSITAGFDRIFVNEDGITQYYFIDKIYELKDKKQVDEIKKQLLKK